MRKTKTCILDYGSGNIQSVYNMFNIIADDVVISNTPQALESATHIVLPGVGAFGASMEKIKMRIPIDILEREVLKHKKPFLGICVGLQLLADKGYEFGEHRGLGWIPGKVVQLNAGTLPLPHIGWNSIEITRPSELLRQFESNQDFYFVHSYAFQATNPENIIAKTDYGEKFSSIIQSENIFGVQFHPEKSQKAGQILLKNFLELT